jgi:hypothetical protein
MDKFEYEIVELANKDYNSRWARMNVLNRMGLERWELVHVDPPNAPSNCYTYTFKRRIIGFERHKA